MEPIYTINNYIEKLKNIIKDKRMQYEVLLADCSLSETSQMRFSQEIKTLSTVIRNLELIQGKPNLYSYWNEGDNSG